MGLVKKNGTIKGNTFNEIYDVFNGKIKRFGDELVVSFNINTSRELALKEALEVKEVRVRDWNRKTDLVAYAYKKGKEKISYETYDETGNLIIKEMDNVFTGWDDDITLLD
jgi:hypothetical protein